MSMSDCLVALPQPAVYCLAREPSILELYPGAAGTTLTQMLPPGKRLNRAHQVMELHGLTPEMLQGPPPAIVTVDYRNDEG